MKLSIIDVKDQKLTPNEEAILNYVNENPDDVTRLTIYDLAKKCYVSVASITRFIQKINFSSYRELQIFVSTRNNEIRNNYLISDSEGLQNLAVNMRSYALFAINETHDHLDLKEIEKLTKKIDSSHRIATFGLGSSANASRELAQSLRRIDYNVFDYSDSHLLIEILATWTKDDIVILFSESLKTKEILHLIDLFTKYQIYFCVITANDTDQINSEYLFSRILCSKLNQETRLGSLSALHSQLYIINLIYSHLFYNKKENKEVYQKDHDMVLEWNKK